MNSTNKLDQLKALLRLRLAVGALGEQEGWWGTKAASPEMLAILRQLYPKSWRLASFSATSEAAKRVHREGLNNRSQHLFRFMTDIEQDLRRLLSSAEGERIFDETLASRKSAEGTLEELALKGQHLRPGPVELGAAEQDAVFESIPKMAGLYGIAFRSGERCYPYFTPKDVTHG